MEVEFTRLSSKGQIVIPQDIRKGLKLEEGTPFAITKQNDTIILKKMDFPKTWKEVTEPFREAARKSGFTQKDLDKLIKEVRT